MILLQKKCGCRKFIEDGTVGNVVIVAFDNSSSSHTNNLKIDFFILGEGDIFALKVA